MKYNKEMLYELLPAIYRNLDKKLIEMLGKDMRSEAVKVVEFQVQTLEKNISSAITEITVQIELLQNSIVKAQDIIGKSRDELGEKFSGFFLDIVIKQTDIFKTDTKNDLISEITQQAKKFRENISIAITEITSQIEPLKKGNVQSLDIIGENIDDLKNSFSDPILDIIVEQINILKMGVIEAIFDVVAEQAEVFEENIDQLYNDWFIETCDRWIVPYIGDLLGVKELNEISQNTFSQRARVANTIGFRRRKGTLRMLEELAYDVTEWPVKGVEFFNILNTTQNLNHLRMFNSNIDLRKPEELELLGTPFDTIPHNVDVRNIQSKLGYYNIQNIGLFFWRLYAYPIKNASAFHHQNGKFSFSQLGIDISLFNNPPDSVSSSNMVEEINIPCKIRRNALSDDLNSKEFLKNYYANYDDEVKSIKIKVDDLLLKSDDVIVCDLSTWCRPPHGKVAIDPELGRICFPNGIIPDTVHVSYYYGFSGEIGGGAYDRKIDNKEKYIVSKNSSTIGTIGTIGTIKEAIDRWKNDNFPDTIVEIADSNIYQNEDIVIDIPSGKKLEIRAANDQRPTIELVNPITITGSGNTSELVIDGLLMYGNKIQVKSGNLKSLTIRHSTLVPGIRLSTDDNIVQNGRPIQPADANLVIDSENNTLAISMDHVICGSIDMKNSGAKLQVTDSIVDGFDTIAITCKECSIINSTVFGQVKVELIGEFSNSIFTKAVTARQRQKGCVRFCYIPDDSEVPPRYKCQPSYPNNSSPAMKKEIALKLKPPFKSTRYGTPEYAQLNNDVSEKIFEGADNFSEIGAFNSLLQPLRIKNFEASLDEYTRFGTEVGMFFAD